MLFLQYVQMEYALNHDQVIWLQLNFLEKRTGFLDGVVISGGEPTLQPDQMCIRDRYYTEKKERMRERSMR